MMPRMEGANAMRTVLETTEYRGLKRMMMTGTVPEDAVPESLPDR
jgi:hypothetical protein